MFNRKDGRSYSAVRSISYQLNPFGNADASVLYFQGNTKIFATVSIQDNVPKFLKKTGKGWLTSEYVMHPYASDQARTNREMFPNGRDYRSVEISRLIGRAFRAVVELVGFGEKTIHLDCDVLQADGGTRTACINALTLALIHAEKKWLQTKKISKPIFREPIFAVSVGLVQGRIMTDLTKDEDSTGEADFNFVISKRGMVVEIQGTAEAYPMAWHDLDDMKKLAIDACQGIATSLNI